jgi:hypothetical protein
VSYGPALNAAAVVLTSYGNMPPERAAHVVDMLLGVPVSAGWVDKAGARLSRQLEQAGFDAAMCAALAAEPVLAADETPVNVLAPGAPAQGPGQEEEDPEDGDRRAPGTQHVLVIRTPDERLSWLQALDSRRKEDVTAGVPPLFTGFLITDGYKAYQRLLPRLAGIHQCCQHVIRRCRAVTKLGPGSLQSWAADVISILREAHQAAEEARARGDTALDPEHLEKMRQRYDEAAAFGIIHNRLRDGHDGNHPATPSAAGCRSTRSRSGCSPANSPSSGPATAPSGPSKARNGTRPSPDTGIPSAPSPGGAASAATSTPPGTTACAPSTPSAPQSKENPGYRRSPHWPDARSRATREWTPSRPLMAAMLRALSASGWTAPSMRSI